MVFQHFIDFFLLLFSSIYPILHPNVMVRLSDLPAEVLMGFYIPLSILAAMVMSYTNNTTLSFLPAFRLYHAGYGREVVKVWALSILIGALLAYFLSEQVVSLFDVIYPIYPWALILISLILLRKEGWVGRGVFVLSGMLGFWALNGPLQDPLTVLFSGFFAVPSIFSRVVKKKLEGYRKGPSPFSVALIPTAVVLSSLFALLPGVSSPSTGIALLSTLIRIDPWAYLSLNGAFLSSQTIMAFKIREELGNVRLGVVVEQKSFDLPLFFTSLLLGSILLWVLYPFADKLFSQSVKYGLLILIILYIFSQEGMIGVGAFLLSSTIGYINRSEGGSAFPFFGSIILPVLLRALL